MTQDKNSLNKDDFWDISSLLPARGKAPVGSGEKDTSAVEVYQSAPTLKGAAFADALFTERPVSPHVAPKGKSQQPLYTYQPQNALLHNVRVYAWSQ